MKYLVKSMKFRLQSLCFKIASIKLMGNETGMTLAEVVAALGLSVLLLGMMSQFLFNGASLWSKNDQAYRKQHQLKFFYQTIANDLENVFTGRFLPEEPFKGEEYLLNCWCEEKNGLKQIGYRYDLQEKAVWRSSGYWGSPVEERKLFGGVTEWRFEYFEPQKSNWVLYWQPSTKTEVPSLVKITAKSDLGVIGPVVIPIKVWRNEEEE